MNKHRFSRSTGCLLLLGLLIQSTTSFANVIYQLREAGSPQVIGTMEIASPPARRDAGWSTSDLGDMVALFLNDSVFGLGNDNLFQTSTFNLSEMSSSNGRTLDQGSLGLELPTVFPVDPAVDPTTFRTLSISFDPRPGEDFLGVTILDVFPDGTEVVGDLFISGDFTATSEPGTLLLLAGALAGFGWMRRARGT
jgi:hypothetical protein